MSLSGHVCGMGLRSGPVPKPTTFSIGPSSPMVMHTISMPQVWFTGASKLCRLRGASGSAFRETRHLGLWGNVSKCCGAGTYLTLGPDSRLQYSIGDINILRPPLMIHSWSDVLFLYPPCTSIHRMFYDRWVANVVAPTPRSHTELPAF